MSNRKRNRCGKGIVDASLHDPGPSNWAAVSATQEGCRYRLSKTNRLLNSNASGFDFSNLASSSTLRAIEYENVEPVVCMSDIDNAASPAATTPSYRDLGDCQHMCRYCSATFWYDERVKGYSEDRRLSYNRCCYGGRVRLPVTADPPEDVKAMLTMNKKLPLQENKRFNIGQHQDYSNIHPTHK